MSRCLHALKCVEMIDIIDKYLHVNNGNACNEFYFSLITFIYFFQSYYRTVAFKNEKAVEFSYVGDILSIKRQCRNEFLQYLGSVMQWEYH